MPEVTNARHDQSDAEAVRGRHGFVVTDGAAGVRHHRTPGGRADFHGVRERDQRIGRRHRAASALARISVAHCASDASGPGHVSVTFGPQGGVTSAVVDGGPYMGTGSGRCVQNAFMGARVPPFAGGAVTVGRNFVVPPGFGGF